MTGTDAVVRWARISGTADLGQRSHAALPAAERDRYADAPASLLGRVLLRALVSELTGTSPVDVAIDARCPDCGREHGRPLLEGGLYASISHSGDLVAVAVAGTPVGVDVEPVHAAVPAIFASDAAGWTRIEAVLKADGRGLRVDPGDVRIDGDAASLGDVDYAVTLREVDGFTLAVAQAVPSRPTRSRTGARAAGR